MPPIGPASSLTKQMPARALAALATLAAGLALAACGGGGTETSTTPAGTGAEAPAADRQDSGGGADQFRSRGGDNSIQEFGAEAGDAERQRAAAALHAFLDARVARRWEEACAYLSADVVASLRQFFASAGKPVGACGRILEALSGQASTAALRKAAQADVGSLRTRGGRGFLLYHGAGGNDFAFPVVEEGGEWKLSAPEGTLLP